jgi:hypothetical protein
MASILCLMERRTDTLGHLKVFASLAFSQCADLVKKGPELPELAPSSWRFYYVPGSGPIGIGS